MFRTACATARQFTFPVVLSRRTVAGDVEAMIGTFVVLNADGWILTAAHIVDAFEQMIIGRELTEGRPALEAAIKADKSLKPKERYDRLKALGKTKPTDTINCSGWWSADGAVITDFHRYPDIDLCVARLDKVDLSTIGAFPTIKDPTKDIDSGVSLCKLGFPFHSVEPVWDDATQSFQFPPGSLPFPLFPIEGMLTREILIEPDGTEPFPFKMLEVSSPGLKGQSGGPIFDSSGTVWAIQSSTLPLPLGFDPVVPGGGGRTEHQFLNVGIGVHCESICAALDLVGVTYAKSAY